MSALIPRNRSAPEPSNSPGKCMDPRGGRHASGVKFVVTMAIAIAADGLQLIFPPLWIPIGIVSALLFFVLWGVRWEIAVVLIPEIAPGIEAFPSWIALALYLGGKPHVSPSVKVEDQPLE